MFNPLEIFIPSMRHRRLKDDYYRQCERYYHEHHDEIDSDEETR